MTEKQKIIVELVAELEKCTLEEYEQIKPILKAQCQNKPHLLAFMEKVFMVVEGKQPKLIEMKGGAVA